MNYRFKGTDMVVTENELEALKIAVKENAVKPDTWTLGYCSDESLKVFYERGLIMRESRS